VAKRNSRLIRISADVSALRERDYYFGPNEDLHMPSDQESRTGATYQPPTQGKRS
jgi:hypothetical protein